MNRIIELFTDPRARFRFLSRRGFYNWMDDKKYIEKEYALALGKKPNLQDPSGFNEKLQWLKLNDRKEVYTKMVDKYTAKKYVARIIGKQYVIPTIGVYDKFDDIDFKKLPNQFVMKCTHDSGGIIICKDKSSFNIRTAKKRISKLLRRKYYYSHREWPYKNVKPRIIVEKYMEDCVAKELIDYKVMCFNGKAKMIFTCTERFNNGLKVTFFDLNWNKLPFTRHYPASDKKIRKPKNFDIMVELSEKMSINIPFVRIDWYEINGELYFGEYTFYPGGGYEEFTPRKWDEIVGSWIDLPDNSEGR